MKYKLGKTKVIHWDLPQDAIINPDIDVVRRLVGAETYVSKKGILPIIIQCKINILKGDEIAFNSIMHTNCLLQFNLNENPINDLMKMFKEAHEQENKEWDNNELSSIDLYQIGVDVDVDLNKSCEIRDIAKQQNLLM
jgi:hypothetical protein